MVEREAPAGPPAETVFKRRVKPFEMLREFWTSRRVLVTLTERELRARYKQAGLGFGWAVITPLALMFVFTVFFDRVARVDTGDIPYPLFAYVGLLSWTFFSQSISIGGPSLHYTSDLLNKVYCPREMFPLAGVGVAGIQALFALPALGVLFALNGWTLSETVVWVPVLLVVQIAFTAGVTMALSVTIVYIRDVLHTLPVVLQLGLFATPVAYGVESVPDRFTRLWTVINPLVGVIDGYRRTVLAGEAPATDLLVLSAAASAAWLVGGYLLLKKLEPGIADVA